MTSEFLILHATDVHRAIAALRHSPVPVLVARPAPALERFPRAIQPATDGSPETRTAAAVTATLAARHGARVVLHTGFSVATARARHDVGNCVR